MREKLIEWCEDVILSCKASLCVDCEHNGIDYPKCMGVHFADHLIANGVTVQQWIPAREPPKDTCEYWIAYKAGGDYYYSTGYFDGKCWCSALTHHKIPVTHWMPLPEPPKEERSYGLPEV